MAQSPKKKNSYDWHNDPVAAFVVNHVKRFPFFYSSLLTHGVIIAAMFYIGSYQIEQATLSQNKEIVGTNISNAYRTDMRRRVDDMKAIQELMKQIAESQKEAQKQIDQEKQEEKQKALDAQKAQQAKGKEAATQDKNAKAEMPEKPKLKTAEEILKEAKEVNDSIQKLEQKVEAEKLAKLLKIPEEEAAKQVQKNAPPPPELPDTRNMSEEQIANELNKYEEQAKKALLKRQEEMERQQQGSKISTEFSHDAGDGQQNGQNKGQANGNAKDKGASGSGSGGQGGNGGQGIAARLSELTRRLTVGEGRSYGQYAGPLPIDPHKIQISSARIFGKDATYSNHIYLNSWQIIGPFEGKNKESINKVYPPEKLVDLDAVYFGKNNRLLKWEYFHAPSYPLVPPGDTEYAIFYGFTEVIMDEERDMIVAIGSDDDAKIWINNQLAWVSGNQFKAWYRAGYFPLINEIKYRNLSEGYRKVHFNKGRNTILFKLYNGYAECFISVVLEPVK